MSKFYGVVGFAETAETSPGIYEDIIEEHPYSGDLLKNFYSNSYNSESTNSDINLSNKISIIGDLYAFSNFHKIVYVEYMSAKWRVTNIDASQQPRLILSLGGVYHENSD